MKILNSYLVEKNKCVDSLLLITDNTMIMILNFPPKNYSVINKYLSLGGGLANESRFISCLTMTTIPGRLFVFSP